MQDNNNQVSSTLEIIANNNMCVEDIGTSAEIVNQCKAFLVAQARNELRRIVKLTTYLDLVEDKFIATTDDLMSEYPDNMSIISETMKALTSCINRSNELITQVVSDDRLNSFITSKPIDDDGTGLTLESRNKIRDMAKLMLKQIDENSENN